MDDENEAAEKEPVERILRKRPRNRRQNTPESSYSEYTASENSRSSSSSIEDFPVRKKKKIRKISISSIESEHSLDPQQTVSSDQNVMEVFSPLRHSVSSSAESDNAENSSNDKSNTQQVHAMFQKLTNGPYDVNFLKDFEHVAGRNVLENLRSLMENSSQTSNQTISEALIENTKEKTATDEIQLVRPTVSSADQPMRNPISSFFRHNDSSSNQESTNHVGIVENNFTIDSVAGTSYIQKTAPDSLAELSMEIAEDNSTAFDTPPDSENSNSTISYFENEFPKNILQPWLKIDIVKNNREIALMLTKTCLKSTYKCMGLCSFSSDQLDHFKDHLQLHSTDEVSSECSSEYRRCSYCDFMAADVDDLVSHLSNEHQNDQYSCKKCFYRSIVKENVTNHFNRYHSNEMFYVVDEERKISSNLGDAALRVTEQRSKFVPLICCPGEFQPSCKYKTYFFFINSVQNFFLHRQRVLGALQK